VKSLYVTALGQPFSRFNNHPFILIHVTQLGRSGIEATTNDIRNYLFAVTLKQIARSLWDFGFFELLASTAI